MKWRHLARARAFERAECGLAQLPKHAVRLAAGNPIAKSSQKGSNGPAATHSSARRPGASGGAAPPSARRESRHAIVPNGSRRGASDGLAD